MAYFCVTNDLGIRDIWPSVDNLPAFLRKGFELIWKRVNRFFNLL